MMLAVLDSPEDLLQHGACRVPLHWGIYYSMVPAGLNSPEDPGEIPIPYVFHLLELANILPLKPRSKQLI